MESKSAFLSLPEEEAFKYFDIFKKTLSGTMGKNMLNMEFPIDQEMPGGTQEFLMKLKASKLEDDMLLEEFYDKVIATYEYAENYYIILIHAMYDVPGRSSDNMEMFDASDEVYEYLSGFVVKGRIKLQCREQLYSGSYPGLGGRYAGQGIFVSGF